VRLQSVWLRRFGAVVLGVLLVGFARECAIHSVDFPVYHRTARQLIAGNFELYPTAVYDGGPMPAHEFRYAPVIAFLFVPFGFLPLELAALVFFILKVAACVYIAAVVARHAGLSAAHRNLLLLALLLVGGYVVEEFRYGNAHFFCVALMVLAYDAAESGRVMTSAVALAVAIATKLTPIALLGYFALRRRWVLCLATAAVLVALALLPAVVVGIDANARLLKGFSVYAMQKIDEEDTNALRGVLVRYLTPAHGADAHHLETTSLASLSPNTVTVIWVLSVMGLGLVGLAVIRPDVDDPIVRLLEFSLVLTGMLLASPHTQRRYFVALYVPVIALVALMVRYPESRQRRTILAGLAAVAATSTVLPLVFGGRALALAYEAASPYFFGTAVLFGVLVAVTARLKGPAEAAKVLSGRRMEEARATATLFDSHRTEAMGDDHDRPAGLRA